MKVTRNPFSVKDTGFIKAGDLEEGAILVDNEGNELHLLIKKWEHLQSPVPVYNFAVEDYHTYFVGSTKVLVHNNCGTGNTANTKRCKLGENMKKAGIKDPGNAYDAHHIFPKTYREKFLELGIDVDDPRFGIFIDLHEHRSSSGAYNKLWESFFARFPDGNLKGHDLENL